MKRIILAILMAVSLVCVDHAEAFNFIDGDLVDFTGNDANRYHPIGYQPLSELTGFIGGDSSSDRLGEASQFVISGQTYLDKITFDMDTSGRSIFFNDKISFDFLIYQGDIDNGGPVPDTQNLLYRSAVQLNFDPAGFYPDGSPIFDDLKNYKGLENKIGLTLDSGRYWFAYERAVVNDYPQGMGNGQFTFAEVTASPVPEPATIFLLGGGLAGAWLRQRRKTK